MFYAPKLVTSITVIFFTLIFVQQIFKVDYNSLLETEIKQTLTNPDSYERIEASHDNINNDTVEVTIKYRSDDIDNGYGQAIYNISAETISNVEIK